MMKRWISLLLALCTVLSVLPVSGLAAGTQRGAAAVQNPFRDVAQDAWYHDDVLYAYANSLFRGVTDTAFAPEDGMSRAMFVTVLGRLAGVKADAYSGGDFTDVAADAYYAPYVAWATKYGIAYGTGGGRFSPDAPVTRQEMAVFFVRYFETFGVDYGAGSAAADSAPADLDQAADWAREAVGKLWRANLLRGSDGRFDPEGRATRAQTAALCRRADGAVGAWYSEPGTASDRVKIDPFAGGSTGTKPSGGSGSSGGSGGTAPGDSYAVRFYDGDTLIDTLYAKKGEPLGQLPAVGKSSKAGYILEGYYADANFATPFYAENPVNGDLSVYAKYESMGDAETLTLDSFARMDQSPDVTFRFRALDGTADTLDAAKAAVTLAVKDGTDPVTIAVSGSGGTYTVSAPDGFHEGCSYELKLAEGWTFVPDGGGTIPSEGIRTAAFSIEMAEVENLSMNDGIRYVRDTAEINYTYTDRAGNTTRDAEILPSDADITEGGSFNYSGDTAGWAAGDILCIYVGGRPDSDEAAPTEAAVYAKIDRIGGGTVSFKPLAEEDRAELYDIPDNFPFQAAALPAENTGTVDFNTLDAALYAQMVGAEAGTPARAREKLSEGDFVTFYTNAAAINSESDVYFGRVTAVSGDTVTYEKCTAADIEASADLYAKVDMTGEDLVSDEEKAAIENRVLSQVRASGFGEDAAWMLLEMASQTDGFQNTAGLRDVLVQDAAGNALSGEDLRYYARSARNVGGKFELSDDVSLTVELINSGDRLHFRNQGLQLAIGVSAEFEIDTKDGGKVHINLSATFVQEVAVNPAIRGELVYKKILKVIPIPTGVQINATVDVKSFTAMSIKAEIFTEAAEEKGLWEKFKDFAKDPTDLGSLPGVPAELTKGLKTVGDAIDKVEEIKGEIDKGLEDAKKLQADLDTLWGVIENVSEKGLTREAYEETCEALGKTNITAELMEMLHLTEGEDLSVDYVDGLSDLMDRYSELLEKETDWVTLVEQEMFNQHTPEKFGVMIGIQGKFMVRADLNLAIGSNLQYEVGKRYNFWFRIGLFKPTSGSSTMDLIDESFAFQFYVMGKIGLKAGVRMKIYAAIGSVDAVSVGLTTELGPYLKLWGFFIYDYSKYRPANAPTWTSREQMAGALYLEFGLYLMVGVEAKALFLDFDKDFVDEEFPLLHAGEKDYPYDMAYEPLDESDEIVVYNDGSVTTQPGCAVSMELPEAAYALKVMDLTTGRQSARAMDYDSYIFQVSNPNFRVDNVGGKPVVSVVSIPQNVRLMQCDLTITYKYGKLAFSTYDMTTTVHLAWTNMTAAEYQQVYTASVTIPDGSGGQEVIWSKRVRKGTPFDLPTAEEIHKLLSWSDAKYVETIGYGDQPTEGITLIEDTQYQYNLAYQTYSVTVTGIQGGSGSQTFAGKYGEPFDFSALLHTGTDGPDVYTRFAGLMMDGEPLALNQPINGKFTASQNAAAVAQYEDETVTATFVFDGIDHADIVVKLRSGGTPDTLAVADAVKTVPDATLTGYSPAVGPMESDTVYQVICELPPAQTAAVTYHANGAADPAAETKQVGSVLGALPALTRTGYTFGGWFTDDGTFEHAVDVNTVVPAGGLHLYAKWTPVEVTVTFNTNGGVNLDADKAEKTVSYGETYGELPAPEWSGHGFRGWWTSADDTGTEITADTAVDTTEDLILYAHWVVLKTIPSSVFTFTPTTKTYTGALNRAVYTFQAEPGETYTQDSFQVEYIRVADQFITDNTAYSEPQYNAGTYNIHITRDADDTYAKFDQNYDGVLIVNQAQPVFTGITAEDITVSDQGLTRAKVTVDATKMLKTNLVLSSHLYYRLSSTGGNESYSHKYTCTADKDGMIRDLPETLYIYQVGTPETINYKEAWSSEFKIQVNKTMPSTNVSVTWTSVASHYNTDWYDDSQDTFQIGTAEELAGLSKLVSQGKTFAGKTVTLTADIDLSAYMWNPIGRTTAETQYGPGKYQGFCGTFDGGGHTITGMYAKQSGFSSSQNDNFAGLFGILGEGRYSTYTDGMLGTFISQFTDIVAHQIVIENLTLEDSFVSSLSGAAAKTAFAGCCVRGAEKKCEITFRNCSMGVLRAGASADKLRLDQWYGISTTGSDPEVENCEILRQDQPIVKEWVAIIK